MLEIIEKSNKVMRGDATCGEKRKHFLLTQAVNAYTITAVRVRRDAFE